MYEHEQHVDVAGRLSYTDPKSWTMRVKLTLKLNFESYLLEQRQCVEEHTQGNGHEHFRWFMFLSDFLKYFRLLFYALCSLS